MYRGCKGKEFRVRHGIYVMKNGIMEVIKIYKIVNGTLDAMCKYDSGNWCWLH